MNLTQRIKENNLPIKQLRVIEGILDDLESNSFLSGAEICEKFDISFSSLTRMAKELKFTGFPELKKVIEKQYRDEFSPSSQAESFIKDSRDRSILNIVMQSEMKNLTKLQAHLDEKELIICAKKTHKAKRVFIIGVGQMEFIAKKFGSSLNLLSKQVICLTELGFSKGIQMHEVEKGDIVLAFSLNKELSEFKELFLAMKKSGVTTVLITDKKTGKLRSNVDFSFHAPASGNGMMNCITPYIVITNILESLLFSLDKHVHLAKIKKIENKWSALPIFL
jgi:DNA-binding MurR/RpiR family transcriptional regulator